MRASIASLTRRIRCILVLRFEADGLTGFAGLALLQHYFATLKVQARIVNTLRGRVPNIDIGVGRAVMVLLLLIITGGRRIHHLGYLQHDPLVRRFCGARQLPSSRTFNRWLAAMDSDAVAALQRLNEELIAQDLRGTCGTRLTVDVDGSVVSTGMTVEGAKRGYNPHHRKVPSYYPITAYEARSGRVLRVQNRAGNVHDGKASVGFLGDLLGQIKRTLPAIRTIECRMDGAFFLAEVLDLLDQHHTKYAIKVPFWRGLDLQRVIRGATHWSRADEDVDYLHHTLEMAGWKRFVRVIIFRKRVHHPSAKNFQLDLFDPSNGYYEYSAAATNLDLTGDALWQFICGRGTHEKVYGELKRGFAFACLPSRKYHANSAWQVLSIIAFNLMRGFQVATDAPARPTNLKRRTKHCFESIHTARFTWLNRPGLIRRPQGKETLDVGTIPEVFLKFTAIQTALAEHRRFMSN